MVFRDKRLSNLMLGVGFFNSENRGINSTCITYVTGDWRLLIRYSRAWSQYSNVLDISQLPTQKQLKQGNSAPRLLLCKQITIVTTI
jgi:hypothetical protein